MEADKQDTNEIPTVRGDDSTRGLSGLYEKSSPTITGALPNSYENIEIRHSPIEGYGIFAKNDIPNDTILEEIPFIMWPRQNVAFADRVHRILDEGNLLSEREQYFEHIRKVFSFKHPDKYYFKWYPSHAPSFKGEQVVFSVIPLGFGPIYNSHNTDNNAGWSIREKTFVFKSIRDIKAGEEVCTFYGYFLSETGEVYDTSTVFGLGFSKMDDGHIYFRAIRFSSDEEKAQRMKEAGFLKLAELLTKSQRTLRLKRISIIENNVEKHPFEFPEGFPLDFHFKKLREFRGSRFQNIKLNFTWKEGKEKAEVIIANHV